MNFKFRAVKLNYDKRGKLHQQNLPSDAKLIQFIINTAWYISLVNRQIFCGVIWFHPREQFEWRYFISRIFIAKKWKFVNKFLLLLTDPQISFIESTREKQWSGKNCRRLLMNCFGFVWSVLILCVVLWSRSIIKRSEWFSHMPQIVDKMRNLLRDESLKSQLSSLSMKTRFPLTADNHLWKLEVLDFVFQIVQKSTPFWWPECCYLNLDDVIWSHSCHLKDFIIAITSASS